MNFTFLHLNFTLELHLFKLTLHPGITVHHFIPMLYPGIDTFYTNTAPWNCIFLYQHCTLELHLLIPILHPRIASFQTNTAPWNCCASFYTNAAPWNWHFLNQHCTLELHLLIPTMQILIPILQLGIAKFYIYTMIRIQCGPMWSPHGTQCTRIALLDCSYALSDGALSQRTACSSDPGQRHVGGAKWLFDRDPRSPVESPNEQNMR